MVVGARRRAAYGTVALALAGAAAQAAELPENLKGERELQDLTTSGLLGQVAHASRVGRRFGDLAERLGQAPPIRRLGQLLQADHVLVMQELEAYAGDRGLAISALPPGATWRWRETEKALERLAALSGREFDRVFLGVLAPTRRRTWRMLVAADDATADPKLEALLRRLALLVRQHARIADRLRDRFGIDEDRDFVPYEEVR